MYNFKASASFLSAACLLVFTAPAWARSIYLNGTDISSARNQTLKNVNLRIDENGHLFIEAPHYQVNEETTFTPLSSWVEGVNSPEHRGPTALSAKVGSTLKAPEAGSKQPHPANLQEVMNPATPQQQLLQKDGQSGVTPAGSAAESSEKANPVDAKTENQQEAYPANN